MTPRPVEELNAIEMFCSFIVHDGGGVFLRVRRSVGEEPLVIFTSKEGGVEHALSLFQLSAKAVREVIGGTEEAR
jgi:hypothetical protein